jgi:MFS transporter, putative metabolite:H+ symporter
VGVETSGFEPFQVPRAVYRGKVRMSTKTQKNNPSDVIARQDNIQVWSLPYLYVVVIGVGFLFTFYDINDINVSFIQTCTQIVPHCLD